MDVTELTMGEISNTILFIVALIGGIIYLKQHIHDWVLGSTDKKIDEIQMESCKDYLVMVIGDLERGTHLSDTELQRFYDRLDMYHKKGGNGYIQAKVKDLQELGILKVI